MNNTTSLESNATSKQLRRHLWSPCPCCSAYNGSNARRAHSKRLDSRMVRRTLKQLLQRDLQQH